MHKKKSVSLIDQCAFRRSGLEHLFLATEFEVRSFETPTDFLSNRPSFGLILVFDSPETIQELESGLGPDKREYPHIVYSDHPDWRRGVDAMRSGAVDYVMVPCELEDILTSINSVETWGDSAREGSNSSHVQENKLSILTRRERQVLAGVIAGLTSRSIGDQLGISPRTVEIHRANMMRKIEVRKSADAIRYIYQLFNADSSAQIMKILN